MNNWLTARRGVMGAAQVAAEVTLDRQRLGRQPTSRLEAGPDPPFLGGLPPRLTDGMVPDHPAQQIERPREPGRCPRWGSNPDWIAFKATSSTGWDTGARGTSYEVVAQGDQIV